MTAGQLERRTAQLAAALSAAGLRRADSVALLLPDSPGLVAAAFACLALGARPQLLDPAAPLAAQAEARDRSGARLLVTFDFQRLIDRALELARVRPGLRVGLLRAAEELPFPRNLLAPLLRASGFGQRPAHEAFFRLAPPRRAALPEGAWAERLLLSDGDADFAALLGGRPRTQERRLPGSAGQPPLHTRQGFSALLADLSAGERYRIATPKARPSVTSSSA